ncbi:MAG: SpoIIE family protein phosphatase, partial [Melioribacteraceae bacterium]|nr:SpoIIE family protein phosphatase [Melioribacteraceae bacterium]
IRLSEKDLLFLFTDGLPEKMNNVDEIYGEERMVSDLNKARDYDTQQIINIITECSNNFSGNMAETDDTTYVAIKIKNIG